jgi:hypothetical protein
VKDFLGLKVETPVVFDPGSWGLPWFMLSLDDSLADTRSFHSFHLYLDALYNYKVPLAEDKWRENMIGKPLIARQNSLDHQLVHLH